MISIIQSYVQYVVFSILCFQVENPEGLFYKLSVQLYTWYLKRELLAVWSFNYLWHNSLETSILEAIDFVWIEQLSF